MKILEEDIENYNEREKYWISFYNTVENGYNICYGGETGPILKGVDNPNSNLTIEQIKIIDKLLKETQESYSKIAEIIGTSKRTILRINNGLSYTREIDYPIRKTPNTKTKLSNTDILEIHNLLKYSYLSHKNIAEMYGVEKSTILKIERGDTKAYKIENEKYPLRKYKSSGAQTPVSYEQVSEVIYYLLNSDLSLREIQRITDVEYSIILNIKSGRSKRYLREGLTYPLRKNYK